MPSSQRNAEIKKSYIRDGIFNGVALGIWLFILAPIIYFGVASFMEQHPLILIPIDICAVAICIGICAYYGNKRAQKFIEEVSKFEKEFEETQKKNAENPLRLESGNYEIKFPTVQEASKYEIKSNIFKFNALFGGEKSIKKGSLVLDGEENNEEEKPFLNPAELRNEKIVGYTLNAFQKERDEERNAHKLTQKRLEEETKKAELADKKAEEETKKAELANKKAEEETKKAELANKKAEEKTKEAEFFKNESIEKSKRIEALEKKLNHEKTAHQMTKKELSEKSNEIIVIKNSNQTLTQEKKDIEMAFQNEKTEKKKIQEEVVQLKTREEKNYICYQEAVQAAECPIKHALMQDPVTLSNGFTYGRKKIAKWRNKQKDEKGYYPDPLSNVLINDIPEKLPTNYMLKSIAEKLSLFSFVSKNIGEEEGKKEGHSLSFKKK